MLCGGKSTRMGSPKALLPFGPETMLQRETPLIVPIVNSQLITYTLLDARFETPACRLAVPGIVFRLGRHVSKTTCR